MIKSILLGVVVIIIVIQFIRPSKNLSDDTSKDIGVIYAEPEEVKAILENPATIVIPIKRLIHGMPKFSLYDGG
jgi:hypothetical protein